MSGPPFIVLLIVATLVDAVVAGSALFVRGTRARSIPRGDPLTVRRVAFAVFATAAAFAGKLPLLFCLGVNLFGVIHLAYLDWVMVVPLMGIAVTVAAHLPESSRWSRRPTAGVRRLALASLVIPPIGLYASFVEPFRLQTEVTEIAATLQRDGSRPIRIAVLADLQIAHVSDYECKAVERLMALEPDVILMPGDLFQGSREMLDTELPALRRLLSRLEAPGGVYIVLGNIDRPGAVERIIENTGVELLVNRIVSVAIGDRRLTIGGVKLSCSSDAAWKVIRQLQTAPGEGDYRVLLAHYPRAVLRLSEHSRIDLVVAGHTHGGQVSLPILGPPMTLAAVPRRIAAGGLHTVRGNAIYVSRGVGLERGQAPRIRFLCPPELSLLVIGRDHPDKRVAAPPRAATVSTRSTRTRATTVRPRTSAPVRSVGSD